MSLAKPVITDLRPDQQLALVAFAKKHGRTWRGKLLDCWWVGACPGMTPEEWAPLQQIRSTHGPAWIDKLPDTNLADQQAS